MSRGKRIAVVEDDASMRRAVERFLAAAGFQACPFGSSEALLESDLAAHVSCLVADLHLPGMSGLELEQQLVRSGNPVPVIFITAHDEPAVREQALALGAVGYLVKPFDGRLLIDALARALGRSGGCMAVQARARGPNSA